ncbi:MAG: LPS-assembly protein LptD [Holophagales bacterium]|nr:LPS-assembly protein LptD [Holophagales bacterium]
MISAGRVRRVVAGSLLAGLLGVASSAGQSEPPPAQPQQPAPDEPSATPAPAPAEAPPAAVPPGPERITFELKIPVEKGGGAVAGSAGSLETEGETDAILSGGVEIRYKDMKITAQHLVLHRDQMTVEAEGEVVFDRGPDRIGAQRVDLDLVTQTGTFWEGTAYVDPDYYFSGSVISKVGENDYEVQDGVLTSCTGDPTPDWSFRMSRAKVTMGGYARIKHATMRVKKLPIFYWPYMLWPAKTDRTTGLLVPNVGYSRQRGAYLGLAHYQVLGPSWDNTIYVDLWEKDYAGLGDEVRYRPSEGTRGQLTAYALHESNVNQTEWRLRWSHETTDLPWGLRGVVSVEEYSDFDFFREFERAERDNTRRFLYSNAFVSGAWGVHSVNVMVDQRETFLSGSSDTVEQRQLPEIEYRLRKLKLGAAPLYLSVDTTASYLESSREDQYDAGYGRFDVKPELTLPVKVAPWLSLALTAGGRATWWGDSVPETRQDPETGQFGSYCDADPAQPGQVFCGETLTRVFPTASAELVGPTFSRIFDTGGEHFSKYKHVIEPRWSYGYVGDFDEQGRVARFDEIDAFTSNNIGEFALVNRLLAKPADPEQGGAFEILSFELAQALSFDDDKPLQSSHDGTRTRAESGISARLRFNPSRDFSLQAQAVYSTLFSGLDSTSLSGRADFGRVDLSLTWFTRWDSETGETRSDQARLGFGLELWPRRLHLVGQVNYDLENAEVQQQRYFLAYQSQCWGFVVEWREQITSSYETSDYRFSITLKNVGTFLDVTGGNSDVGR